MRDRFRGAGCQAEMIDQVCGRSLQSVDKKFGSNFLLRDIFKQMDVLKLREGG